MHPLSLLMVIRFLADAMLALMHYLGLQGLLRLTAHLNKKRFAWIKYKKITKEAFYEWPERASIERDKCIAIREATDDGNAKLRALEELEKWLTEN